MIWLQLLKYRKLILYFIFIFSLIGLVWYAKIKYDELIITKMEIANLKEEIKNTKQLIIDSEISKKELISQLNQLELKQIEQDKKLRQKFKNFNTLTKPEQKEMIDKTLVEMLNDIEKIANEVEK